MTKTSVRRKAKRAEEKSYRSDQPADGFELYLKEISEYKLLDRDEEFALMTRIAAHIETCIATIVALLTDCPIVIDDDASQDPEGRDAAVKRFRSHPYVVRNLGPQDVEKMDEALREFARRLIVEWKTEGLDEKAIEKNVREEMRSERCAGRLLQFVSKEAKEDFDRMVASNLRLVVSYAKEYSGLPMIDLVQEGSFALSRAVARFDVSRGNRFATYAGWWIHFYLKRARNNTSRVIRLPVYAIEDYTKIARASKKLIGEKCRPPTVAEISEETGLPEERVEHRLTNPRRYLSIHRPVRMTLNGDPRPLSNVIADEKAHPVEMISLRRDTVRLRHAMRVLTPVERDVLEKYYGLYGGKPMIYREIAPHYGICRERIRQIALRAIEKLREVMVCP